MHLSFVAEIVIRSRRPSRVTDRDVRIGHPGTAKAVNPVFSVRARLTEAMGSLHGEIGRIALGISPPPEKPAQKERPRKGAIGKGGQKVGSSLLRTDPTKGGGMCTSMGARRPRLLRSFR